LFPVVFATGSRATGALLSALLLVAVLSSYAGAQDEDTRLHRGDRARVRGTGGVGLWVQAGPGLGHPGRAVLRDGLAVRVLAGPVARDGYEWYKVTGYDHSGSAGWSAGRWLAPAPRPRVTPRVASKPRSAQASGPRGLTIPVLMYHNVGHGWGRYAVTMAAFREQMSWLRNNGYTTVTLPRVYRYIDGDGTLPRKPVVVTFDDGWASQWNAALELRARGMVGVFFVMGGGIGLSDAQLRRMVAWGHEIEAHSMTHPDLTQLSDARLRTEVAGPKSVLESRLGVPIRYFAYPYGSYDARVLEAVADAGYRGGLAAWGGGYWTPDKRWAQPRIEIGGYATLHEFASLVRSATRAR
jgi:peptidoglycan/xylan/chitin deacetylase (PgdA/CDA1 family)